MGRALGLEEGLAQLGQIRDAGKLEDYPFYPAAQGGSHLIAGRPEKAKKHLEFVRLKARYCRARARSLLVGGSFVNEC